MIKRPHKNLKHQLLLMFFLCATLLVVQLATLTHSVDHSFHKHQELCNSFLAFEHCASVTSSVVVIIAKPVLALPYSTISLAVITQAVTFSFIRAPPFSFSPQ